MGLLIRVPPPPAPVEWTLDLQAGSDQSMRIAGEFDRGRTKPTSIAKPDLVLNVTSVHWPLAVTVRGVDVTGELDGKLSIDRVNAIWKTAGSAELKDLKARGEPLKGDRSTSRRSQLNGRLLVAMGAGGSGEWSDRHR